MLTTREPLSLRQVFNFRDLGGLPTADGSTVQTGRIFRADGLYRLVAEDRDVLDPLGLRTVIDLRTDAEVERWGHAPTAATDAEIHHYSVIKTTWDRDAVDHAVDAATFLSGQYLMMLDEGRHELSAVLRLIGNSERHGVVFHCAAGKDRTGVVAGLLLALAGVADADIAADYSATAPNVLRMQEWYRNEHPEMREVMAQQPPAFMKCPPEAMLTFLDGVRDRWGSVESLVGDHLGLDAHEIGGLRSALLA